MGSLFGKCILLHFHTQTTPETLSFHLAGAVIHFTDPPKARAALQLGAAVLPQGILPARFCDDFLLKGQGDRAPGEHTGGLVRHTCDKERKLHTEEAAPSVKFLSLVSLFPLKCVKNHCPPSKSDGQILESIFHFGEKPTLWHTPGDQLRGKLSIEYCPLGPL